MIMRLFSWHQNLLVNFRQLKTFFTGIAFSFLAFFYISSYGSFSLQSKVLDGRGQYFAAQALQMLHGHWGVSPANLSQGGECWAYKGQCMGYFGLFPSLVRIPIALIFNNHHEFNFLFILIAYYLYLYYCTKAALLVLKKELRDSSALQAILALVIGVSPLLFLGFRMYVYEEAILWSVALLSATSYYLLKYLKFNRDLHFYIATFFAFCTINSRISEGIGAVAACLLAALFKKNTGRSQITEIGLKLALSIAVFCSYFVFNLAKFGVLVPSPTRNGGYANDLSRLEFLNRCQVISPLRSARGFLAYFLPNFHNWPFGFAYSLNRNPIGEHSLVLSNCMEREWWSPFSVSFPLTFCLLVLALFSIIKKLSSLYALPLVIGLSIGFLPTFAFIGFTERYLADFQVFTVLSIICSPWAKKFGEKTLKINQPVLLLITVLTPLQYILVYVLSIHFYKLSGDVPIALEHLPFAKLLLN